VHTGAHEDARRDFTEALTLAARVGLRLHEADAHLGLARLALTENDRAVARDHLARARALIDVTRYHRRDAELGVLDAELRALTEKPRASAALPAASPAALTTMATAERPVDFLIVAPLEEERDALLAKLPGHRRLDPDGEDVHTYFEATVATRREDGAVYRIIVTSPVGMGSIAAEVSTARSVTRWRPEHVLVVGIAAGLAAEVDLGDVMVASSVADYAVSKVASGAPRQERWKVFRADAALLSAADTFRTGWEDLVTAQRPESDGAAGRHVGVIASGGDVIASKEVIATYRADMPSLIGVEMEGAGIAAGLHAARPRFLMIRGVSELADAESNIATRKLWRAYARDVAAAYAVGFLRSGPVRPR
jgi:adenosylhomocysteine nucleosidase